MVVRIDHVGIAVNNIESTMKLYSDVFGLKDEDIEIEEVEEQKVRVAMIPAGESRIELLESTDSEGPIARYIKKRGEGIHHLALGVDNIRSMLMTLREKGVPLIDTEPRIGAGGARIAFLHPKGMGVLIELMER